MAIAEQIAKERGLKIKYIWMHLEKESFRGNFINDASPVEFLNYVYYACLYSFYFYVLSRAAYKTSENSV